MGKRIKQVRQEKNLTQRDIAEKVNVAPSTIMRYEQGTISDIKIPVIESIAKALNVNPSWLLGYDVPMQVNSQPYYLNPDAAAFAQEISERPGLRALFSAARDVNEEDLRLMVEMAERFKKESGED
ncbi:MAG: helix-turn-helix domain-containing protein [Phocaeicola sp.]